MFVLIYDIPVSETTLKVYVNRKLRRIGAIPIQKSVWKHSSLEKLFGIALAIKNSGGKASILEEKFIF